MPTRNLRIDGCTGQMSVVNSACSAAHTTPLNHLDDVYFHTDLEYVHLVSSHQLMNGLILPAVQREYFTYTSGGSGCGGSGCFITTACVEVMGLDDDCDELETLRQFRDELMESSFENAATIADYYECAPNIVEKLDTRPDKQEFYTEVYHKFIVPAVAAIKDNDQKLALGIYAAGVAFCAAGAEEVGDA